MIFEPLYAECILLDTLEFSEIRVVCLKCNTCIPNEITDASNVFGNNIYSNLLYAWP